jgi:integrase
MAERPASTDSADSAPRPTPRLLDRLRQAMRTRHLSLRSEEAYTGWVRRYVLFHGKRHPDAMGAPEINAFLTHLAVDGNVSASTQNQALAAIVFLYRHVLGRPVGNLEGLVRVKRPARLPVFLTRDEVRATLARFEGVHLLIGGLLYGAGLRLLECLRLRVKDLDFDYRQLTTRDGKGGRDRVTMLPASLRDPLREHLAEVQRPATTSTSRASAAPSARLCAAPASPSPRAATPCATPSPPTSSRTATTSAPSRTSSATSTSRPR